jgi:hypothetical protein
MMSHDYFPEELARFLSQLKPEDLDQTAFLDDLQKMSSSLNAEDLSGLSAPKFSFEKAGSRTVLPVEEKHLDRLRAVTKAIKPATEPAYRISSREVPLAQSLIAGSQPDWAAGAAPKRTVGPISTQDGRRVWFDFYPILKLVSLYLPGEQEPALLFHAPDLRPTKQIRFMLKESSLWVRADLLASGSPASTYVGFKVKSGQIVLPKASQVVSGKLTIPPGESCSVRLQMLSPEILPSGGSESTNDVNASEVRLPNNLEFHFSQTEKGIDSIGQARWKIYGQQISFEWDSEEQPYYDSALKGILVPFNPSVGEISVQESYSPLVQASGGAKIQQSAWLLPVAAIDVNQPTEAGGNGGIAVLGNSTLSLTWRGLHDGPVRLPNPWIVLFPGLLIMMDLHAGNLYANQRFLLWQDADSPYRSSVEVQYTDSFPLLYAAGAQGAELVIAQVNAEGKLDRPVDVGGNALEILTKKSLLVLIYTDAFQIVYLYDDNILVDHLDPKQPLPGQFPEPIALALQNALFTTTPINGFLLFAELLDEEMIDIGNVFLVFGLYGLLPTLPDPYAANTGICRRLSIRMR